MGLGISNDTPDKEKIFADYNDILKSMNSVGAISYVLYSALYDIGRALATTEYDLGLRDATANIKSVVEGTSENDATKIRQLQNFLLITEIPPEQLLQAIQQFEGKNESVRRPYC